MKKILNFLISFSFCTYAFASNSVTVLTYHSINNRHNSMSTTEETFNQQINYLISKKVNFISSKALVNAIKNKQELPENTVVITFDDGWKNQNVAMEILTKHNIPATFALVTRFQEHNYATCLQKEDFIKYQKSPFIYVNHSYTHNVKDYLSHTEEDLNKSEKVLTNLKSLPIHIENYYVYPYGKRNNSLIQSIKDHHYVAAFGVQGYKFSTKNVDIYNIPRFLVNDKTDLKKIIN